MNWEIKKVVPQVGFEPTRPKAEDFESTKSTNSITVAHSKLKLECNYTVLDLNKS